jgi:bifunctional non-homologous end joining protein LigD
VTLAIPAPMLAREGDRPFTDPYWIYEIKYDGYRCMARAGGGKAVELRTRRGANCTKWFPEIARLLEELPGGPHVIDGEACVLDDIGRSDFNCLEDRAKRRRWYPGCDPVTLCAFDVLYVDGRNVMGLPLMERKELLRELLDPLRGRLVIVGDFAADAALFQTIVMGAKLEGLVAKRRTSPYQPGVRSRDWLKIKRPDWQEGRTWRK